MRWARVLGVLLIGVGIVVIAGCMSGVYTLEDGTTLDKVHYETIYIEGMPCVKIVDHNRLGLSCNWSRWEGE